MTRGQIIPKDRDIPHKKFLVRVYIGRDEQGKRKYHSEIVNGTISDAKKKLTALLNGIDTSSFVSPSKMTLSSYLTQWLDNKRDIEKRTGAEYRHWMQKHVIPNLGSIKLGKLAKLHVQQLYGSLSSDHNLSNRSITLIHSILRQALDAAVQDKLIALNPTLGARASIPKVDEEKVDMVCLSFEQTHSLIEKTKDDQWGALWRLLLTTGLRQQEALALKWDDITKREGVTYLTINRTLKQTEKPGVYIAREFAAKNATSRRLIVLSEETAAALQVHRKRQLEEMLKAGPKMKREGWVFVARDGSFFNPRNARHQWHKMIAALGLPKCRLHDTRHTHITHLLSSGVNPKAVAARSGHANPTVLLKTYAHVLPEVALDAANIVERRITNAGRPAVDGGEVAVVQGLKARGSA